MRAEEYGFNTQPPEGGWTLRGRSPRGRGAGFNTQPPEGGWPKDEKSVVGSTGFNTQPPEGGWG